MNQASPELERWDLYPFGERSPSKIWDRVADHPAWIPSPAQLAPQFLPAYQIHNNRLVTPLISSVWGYRTSSTGIRVGGYLFARFHSSPAGRSLRVLRCLGYQDDNLPLYRMILSYLVGLGIMQGCSRIEWEILDPALVAVPATFDLIGPCGDPGIGEVLTRRGFRVEKEWVYHQGPVDFGPPFREGFVRLGPVQEAWKNYAARHLGALLPHPVPGLDLPILGRFLPDGIDDTLYQPAENGPIGQWCPDLAPLIDAMGRWDEGHRRVKTIRLLRWFPPGKPDATSELPPLLPDSMRDRFPEATRVQIGPLPVSDEIGARQLEDAGFPPFATLKLMTCSL